MSVNVALTSTEPDMNGIIPDLFKESPYLLIIDWDTGELLHTEEFPKDKEVDMARLILNWKCEAVVCGPLEQPPFDILALEGHVTRFDGSGLPVMEALARLNYNQLEYIKDFVGGTGCPSVIEGQDTFCGHDHDHDHDHGHNHHHDHDDGNGHHH